MSRNTHRLAGGIAKREREAWLRPCRFTDCPSPVVALVESIQGPQAACCAHALEGERLGYRVTWGPLELLELSAPVVLKYSNNAVLNDSVRAALKGK